MSFNALSFILLMVAGVFLVVAVFLARRNASIEARLQSALTENEALSQKAQALESLQQQFAALKAGSEAREQSGQEQLQLLKSAEERLRENFENLAQRIFEEKTSKFKEQNKEQLDALLNPLKTQISEFKQTVQQTNQGIHTLKELNVRMADEAINLTRALKGDNKAQGGWGEQVLGRILDASGLTEGRDYHTQFSYVDENQNRKQPDCVIFLPENKAIVVDSKVSLVAYDRYINAENEQARELALKEHVRSLKTHIDGLSAKSYDALPDKRNLDFVLIFIPIESAFIDALRLDDALYTYALDKNIVLAAPSTVLATCRTVAHLQKLDQRSTNAMKIADQAGKLYDQFVAFCGDLNKVTKALAMANEAHDSALKRLSSGKGNLVRQTEQIKALGAKTSKTIPTNLLEDDADDSPGKLGIDE
ncbi:MAG TPA: DNA recombination protein RmuC [Arenimonas sp.]|nr:DNA recombination protein RmuC [Arenimonas sp.]HOZ03869.1 DNA recombination protein RmuC [Arenimonas sp.]HPO24479.1 DNA recombination protein RmuC [Arenimonas sp.]HPW32837.1 DNA recombination protein RmuC [Arenimonas sp.]